MEDKKALYGEDEILTIEFDDGVSIECGVMGVFDVNGKEYIALDTLDDSDDVYLYGYKATEEDFELEDIPEDVFESVAAEFERQMKEPEAE